ncbi:MAG: YHYH protein [Burkholderiaceae bacterium]
MKAATIIGCGGSDDSTSITVPGAPTIGTANAGNASASVAFTAPASNGGAAISGYTATCTAGAMSITGTGTASPISVTGLTNGATYSCSVAATNSAGTGATSNAVSVTPVAAGSSGSSTAGVECSYTYSAFNSSTSVNATSTSAWTCNTASRVLAANGVPDHVVGTFPNANNPNIISAQTVAATYALTPAYNGTVTSLGGPRGTTGYILNGVKIDAGTGGSCPASSTTASSCSAVDNSGAWNIEALGQTFFSFGTDTNNAHVQPDGAYHYHGMPEGFITLRGGGPTKMTLIGWAADGFPIYARYGYSVATDASSPLKVITGSYKLKTTISATRLSTTVFTPGGFAQDWEYVAGSGDLDECNGRVGVTPEFPNGIYHYYATDRYPYLQRCVKGTVTVNAAPPPR